MKVQRPASVSCSRRLPTASVFTAMSAFSAILPSSLAFM